MDPHTPAPGFPGPNTTSEHQLPETDPEAKSFTSVFASNPLIMWIYDLQTQQFLAVNETAVAYYGYSHEEFLRMRITDIRSREDEPRLLDVSGEVSPQVQSSDEWCHRLKDGQLINVQENAYSVEFDGRKSALVVVQNITELKRIQRKLQLLAAVVLSAEDAIIGKSIEGIIQTWNRGAV